MWAPEPLSHGERDGFMHGNAKRFRSCVEGKGVRCEPFSRLTPHPPRQNRHAARSGARVPPSPDGRRLQVVREKDAA